MIKIEDIPRVLLEGGFEVLQIDPLRFDAELLRLEAQLVVKKWPPMQKDGYDGYSALCLQSRPNAPVPIYDDVQQGVGVVVGGQFRDGKVYEGRCNIRTVIAHHFQSIFDDASRMGLELERGRILIAEPQFVMTYHSDGVRNFRLHVPLQTNEGSFVEFRESGNIHQMEPGRYYLFNAEPYHRAVNLGKDRRIHITFARIHLKDMA